jgi:cell division protein FtsB
VREVRYNRCARRVALYSRAKCVILARHAPTDGRIQVKKTLASPVSGSQLRRRRRQAIEYALVFIGCLVIIQGLVGEKGLLTMLKARQQYRMLEASLVASKAQNARLREEARRLKEDPSAIEDLARRELGLIKPGEMLFIIKDVTPAGK